MFVALDKVTNNRVTSIDPEWNARVEELREWARSGRVVCPGCQQVLWLRTGEVRRRHFAHRQSASCPLAAESAEVLEVKAQLYEWLTTKFPGNVALDVDLGIAGWKKPADLVVSAGPKQRFVYFVFDRQQRFREALLGWASAADGTVHFIHTESVRHRQEPGLRIALTASQRDFICYTEYDEPSKFGGHLYFVNPATSQLMIYRGLTCVHDPNVYAWQSEVKGLLKEALIRPKTGEIVFAADVEARKRRLQQEEEERRRREEEHRRWEEARRRQQEERRKERERQREEQKEEDRRRREARMAAAASSKPTHAPRSAGIPVVSSPPPTPEPRVVPPPPPPKPALNIQGPFRCESCGQETMDWSSATPSEGTCICKNCTRKQWELAKDQPKAKWR